jgi:hypothetical protein
VLGRRPALRPALPHPARGAARAAGRARAARLAGRLFGEPLDRDRPLWEIHLVDGLGAGRFALVAKIHHALADGVSGVDIAALLLDVEPCAPDEPAAGRRPWSAPPPPSNAELLARGATEQIRDAAGALRSLARGDDPPGGGGPGVRARRSRRHRSRRDAPGGRPALAVQRAADATRTYAWTRVPLDAVRAVKDRAGATVNDVVLAGVTGALRRHLLRDGHAVDGLVLKAMVPSRRAPRRSTARWATASRRCTRRCPCTSPIRASASPRS